jgi:hypothetical protein
MRRTREPMRGRARLESQIRPISLLDCAQASGETGGARITERGVAQHLVRQRRAGLRLAHGREQAEQLHGLEDALHVAAARLARELSDISVEDILRSIGSMEDDSRLNEVVLPGGSFKTSASAMIRRTSS